MASIDALIFGDVMSQKISKTPLVCHGLSGLSQGPRAPGKDKQALPFDCKALLQGSLGHRLSLHDL